MKVPSTIQRPGIGSFTLRQTRKHQPQLNTKSVVFYSPNIQSKSIIDSQTSTVKIQPFFSFCFPRYRGPLPENGGSPARKVSSSSSFPPLQIMLMDHYLYKLLKWPSHSWIKLAFAAHLTMRKKTPKQRETRTSQSEALRGSSVFLSVFFGCQLPNEPADFCWVPPQVICKYFVSPGPFFVYSCSSTHSCLLLKY